MAFTLPDLGFAFDALEPHIDARTMEIHHGKHHNGYTNNLNKAIAGSDLDGKSIEDILSGMDMANGALRNNAGGFSITVCFGKSFHLTTEVVCLENY